MMEKPIKYASVPEYFDETKNYIIQLPPVDMGDYIFIDVAVKDLDLSSSPVIDVPKEPCEPYIPEPTDAQRIADLEVTVADLTAKLNDKGLIP
jgi:hypothetical protein